MSTDCKKETHDKWGGLLIALCAVCYFVSYISRINYGAVILEIERSEDISKVAASMAVTGSFITYGFGQLISGWMGDRMKPERLIFAGLLISALMNALVPSFPRPSLILIFWCINGFAQALMWPPMVKILSAFLDEEGYKKRMRQSDMGIFRRHHRSLSDGPCLHHVEGMEKPLFPVRGYRPDIRFPLDEMDLCGGNEIRPWGKAERSGGGKTGKKRPKKGKGWRKPVFCAMADAGAHHGRDRHAGDPAGWDHYLDAQLCFGYFSPRQFDLHTDRGGFACVFDHLSGTGFCVEQEDDPKRIDLCGNRVFCRILRRASAGFSPFFWSRFIDIAGGARNRMYVRGECNSGEHDSALFQK